MNSPDAKFVIGKGMKGWLRRQGRIMRVWQRKYFVINEVCLYCFNKEDDTQIAHTYVLQNYDVRELSCNLDDPDKFVFELMPAGNSGHESLALCAASNKERAEWMKALYFYIYFTKGGAIFGIPLEITMKYEHEHGRTMPCIVEVCVLHLSANAMDVEGIFRLPGRSGLLKDLRSKFDTGQKPVLKDVDVHTVASLLKTYLRELPESLVPPRLYQRAMNFAWRFSKADSPEEQAVEVDGLKKLLHDELNCSNYTTLAFICRFLHRLTAHSEHTKMNIHNLSLVFGPNFIHHHLDDSAEMLMATVDLTQHLAAMLIAYCDTALPYNSEKESVNSPINTTNQTIFSQQNASIPALIDLKDGVKTRETALDISHSTVRLPDFYFDCLCGDDLNSSLSSPELPCICYETQHYNGTMNSTTACFKDSLPQKTDESFNAELSVSAGLTNAPCVMMRKQSAKKRRKAVLVEMSTGVNHLHSSDILKALANVSLASDLQTTTVSAASQSRNECGQNDMKISIKRSLSHKPDVTRSIHQVDADTSHHASKGSTHVMSGDARCEATTSHLTCEGQGECSNVKCELERVVCDLRAQLREMREKQEAVVTGLREQHRAAMAVFAANLDSERVSRAEAVRRTVDLQARLSRYNMLYGDLP